MGAAVGLQRFLLLSYCLGCCLPTFGADQNPLRTVHQWTELDFVFPNDAARSDAVAKGWFVQGTPVPIDVDVQHRRGDKWSRIFVTVPRFDAGRPVTLGTVNEQGRVVPYPDYSWHSDQGANCDGLTSVFRIAIDKCQRLWAMDTGKIGEQQVCPPQLVAFNLNKDEVVYRHKVDKKNYEPVSLYVTPVVDVRESDGSTCADTWVYVADVTGFSILVVDVVRNRSWRIRHRLFFPYPNRGTFTIDGQSFDLMDGVLGLALSPKSPYNSDRYLYFHALASTTENFVRVSLLRNESYDSIPDMDPESVQVFPEERPSQAAAQAMDKQGIMFFGLMHPPSIYCWNSATEYSPRNFHRVAFDMEALQFASGLKIVDNLKGEQELWVLTSSFQRVMTGTLSSDRVNFRIHAEKVHHLLRGSRCLNPPKDQLQGYHANRIMPSGWRPGGHYKYGPVSFL